jgi:carbonic anhydrase/acetyltransferase-like protein (isoleucine patch superfamily)
MSDIVVFGAGRIAEVAATYIEASAVHRIVGFTVDSSHCHQPSFLGRPLVAWEELEQHFAPNSVQLLGPLSFRRLNAFRRERYHEGKRRGYRFASFVHPNVEQLNVTIGENCLILGGVTLEPYVSVGDNTMIWSRAHIGHHSVIESHCFIGPGVGIGSVCTVGEGSMFGPKSDLQSGCSVGRDCFMYAGAQIAENARDGSVFIMRRQAELARYPSRHIAKWI